MVLAVLKLLFVYNDYDCCSTMLLNPSDHHNYYDPGCHQVFLSSNQRACYSLTKMRTIGVARLNAMKSMFKEAANSQLHFPSTPKFNGDAGDAEDRMLIGTDGAGYAQHIGDGFSTIRRARGFVDGSGQYELLKLLLMQ